jgi:hypothetical protein
LNARGEVNWFSAITWVARTVFAPETMGGAEGLFWGAFLKVLHSTTTPHLPTRSSRI